MNETLPLREPAPATPRTPHPVMPGERIPTLDVIRGAAVLGILMVNIQVFAMPQIVQDNPIAYGDMTGANRAVWHAIHLLFEGKFHTIFAVLFGAGMVIMLDRRDAEKPVRFHYRRMAGLLAIGMAHAYLLWFGDILVGYALCGCVLVVLRNLRTTWLVAIACAMLAVPILFLLGTYGLILAFPEHAGDAILGEWWPSSETLEADVATYQGPWWQQLLPRITAALMFQTIVFGAITFWRMGALVLLGIALLRLGFLTGARSTRFYIVTGIATALPGLALVEAGVQANLARNFDPYFVLPFGVQFNYWGSLFVATAWTCAFILLAKHAPRARFTTALAAVGRTALSNYILQSVICTWIFYGHGLGWYGETPRTTQLLIVIGIWILQLLLAPLWLQYFRFGPLEYLWRWTTYGHRPGMETLYTSSHAQKPSECP